MDIDAPYKSRLFNFLNRQILHGLDRLGQAARRAKVAAIWSAQILAYPLYLTVQTGRLLAQKTGEKARETLNKLSPFREATTLEREMVQLPASLPLNAPEAPAADSPILRILEVLEPWVQAKILLSGLEIAPGKLASSETASESLMISEEGEMSAQTEQAPEIIGIASNLESRHLVFVSANNQVLDILTQEQQEQLQRRIILEVANFHRERKALQEGKFALLVPSDAADDDRVFLPLRWFWRAMGWMQRSPVAIAINLFEESALVAPAVPVAAPVPAELPSLARARQPFAPTQEVRIPPTAIAILEPIDRTVADLEVKLGENEIVRAIADTPVPVGWLEDLNIPLPVPPPATAPQRATDEEIWTIQTLIRAAIDYFFGHVSDDSPLSEATDDLPLPQRKQQPRRANLSGGASPPPFLKASANPPLPARADIEADLWLSWDDLYGEEADEEFTEDPINFSVSARLAAAPPTPRLKEAAPEPVSSPSPLPQPKTRSRLRPIPQPNEKSLARIASEVTRLQRRRPYPQPSPLVESNPEAEEVAEWLEVEATTTGYVKHPLEQILEWLDRFMLWFEEFLLSIWRWIYRRLR
ncbi:hypothetical protein [Oscillatoria sp. FACHB-1406]|uniref:hypothetical protein n=1 Tax=Oscillatoria sp. FACHB-1406 TaxID=2692846 RepID=UPI001686D8E7|nr:hypothetical protein [Oscillatoria sp. FACHB-1406]MBD2579282.1 hypothetical protein [Oscillatoria sp. FACHB-1406]